MVLGCEVKPLGDLRNRQPLGDHLDDLGLAELVARGELKLNIDIADIGAAITRITDELPSAADLERVQRRLGGDWLVR
jgi:hypothetical protein